MLAAKRPSVLVALHHGAFDTNVSVCRLKPNRHAGSHALYRQLCSYADDRVVWPGHSGIRDRGCSPGKNAGVSGLDMRVGSEDGGYAAVQPACEADLLARRFGVKVDQDHPRSA